MRHQNVIDRQGSVHEGLFNAYRGSLIDLACGAGRFAIVQPYEQLDPRQLTDAPPTCTACSAIASKAPGAPPHLAEVTRAHAASIVARADRRGEPPMLDNEGLRIAFDDLAPANVPARDLYPLIREHLADILTDRALAVPDGVPEVQIPYTRYTGGTVPAPIGVGDRVMYDGIASGHWTRSRVTAITDTQDGIVVTLQDEGSNWHPRTWPAEDFVRHHVKIDRAATPGPPASPKVSTTAGQAPLLDFRAAGSQPVAASPRPSPPTSARSTAHHWPSSPPSTRGPRT